MIKRILIVLLLMLSSASFCFANVSPIKLEDMIKQSDYIVVGKVTKVESIKGSKFAVVQVSEALKGDSSITQIYYSASPSWICDSSDAEEGETAIYFLRASLAKGEKPSRFPKRLSAILQGAPLYSLEHSGRGRLIPKSINGLDYLFVSKFDDVLFPESIQIAQRPDSNDLNSGYVRLADVLTFIKSEIAGKR